VVGEGDLGNLVWDVTNGQEGLLDQDLEEGFKSDAMKIECDPIWVDTRLLKDYDYKSAVAQADAKGTGLPYPRCPDTGITDPDVGSGPGAGGAEGAGGTE